MLVVDVPERDFIEDAQGVRHLPQHGHLRPSDGTASDDRDEVGDVRDVLQGVTADDDVRRQVEVLRAIQLSDEAQPRDDLRRQPLGSDGRVDADPAVVPKLGHDREELTLAAADLEDVAVVDVVAVDPALGELAGEGLEARREPLGLLVRSRSSG